MFVLSKMSQQILDMGLRNLVQRLDMTSCTYKKESATYCLSVPLCVPFSFPPTKTSVTDFIGARILKLCVHLEICQVYSVKENQDDFVYLRNSSALAVFPE